MAMRGWRSNGLRACAVLIVASCATGRRHGSGGGDAGATGAGSDAGPGGGRFDAGTGPGGTDAGRIGGGSCRGLVHWRTAECDTCLNTTCCEATAICEADTRCVQLFNCGSACAASDTECQFACYMLYGDGASASTEMANCIDAHCSTQCSNTTP